MQFRLLGPLEVAEQNMAAALGRVEQCSLPANLLLHANEVVATDRLIGELSAIAARRAALTRGGRRRGGRSWNAFRSSLTGVRGGAVSARF